MASPASVGMSAPGLARIQPAMQALVEEGKLAGVVTLVARGGRIVHWQAVGMRDIEAEDRLEPDDIFRIYSLTKPVTSAAVMMLVESGDIALTDPVSSFIPAFADLTVLEPDGSRSPVARAVTVLDLLRHTSGLTYGFGRAPVDRMYRQSGVSAVLGIEPVPGADAGGISDLGEFVSAVAELPLIAQPGERLSYGVSTDVLGHIVQLVSGRPLGVFLEERIFEPLGMDDTAFWVPAERRGRFTSHYRLSNGRLELADSAETGRYTRVPPIAFGGSGLVSTASDYIRFAQMLLQDGTLGGVRVLEAETVRAMRSNQLADEIPASGLVGPGYRFGLGFSVLTDEDATPVADHNGLFRWSGYANTFFWIDPEAELIALVWTQLTPYGAHDLDESFQALVYDAFREPLS